MRRYVGVLTTSFQTLWTISGPSRNVFVRGYVKAAIDGTTAVHDDHADTRTIIVAGTY